VNTLNVLAQVFDTLWDFVDKEKPTEALVESLKT